MYWTVQVFSCTCNREFTVTVRAADSFEAWTKAVESLYGRGYYGRLIRLSCKKEGRA